MRLSRRDFLKYCGASAVALGLSRMDLRLLQAALANPNAPSVVWLKGSGCYGCSISFLNRISSTAPTTAADLLIHSVNLAYHPLLMGPSGEQAVAAAKKAAGGPFILVVEGGIPTAQDGAACLAWTWAGKEVTFLEGVKEFAAKATDVVSVGTCAAFGGIAAAPPNPTQVKDVRTVTGRKAVNVPGCPPHPDWIVWTLAQLLLEKPIDTDDYGRPEELYDEILCDACAREGTEEVSRFGVEGCLERLGCRGERTHANCPGQLWNGRTSFCIEANAPCIGCTEPTFPGTGAFYGRGGRAPQGRPPGPAGR
jgi:hydrogenase small subunit